MKLYFCKIDKEHFLKTTKSASGWIRFDDNGDYEIYDFYFNNIPESWEEELLTDIEIPETLWEDCYYCNNHGYDREDGTRCVCIHGINCKHKDLIEF